MLISNVLKVLVIQQTRKSILNHTHGKSLSMPWFLFKVFYEACMGPLKENQ